MSPMTTLYAQVMSPLHEAAQRDGCVVTPQGVGVGVDDMTIRNRPDASTVDGSGVAERQWAEAACGEETWIYGGA